LRQEIEDQKTALARKLQQDEIAEERKRMD